MYYISTRKLRSILTTPFRYSGVSFIVQSIYSAFRISLSGLVPKEGGDRGAGHSLLAIQSVGKNLWIMGKVLSNKSACLDFCHYISSAVCVEPN